MNFTVEFFVRNPFYLDIEADTRDEAEKKAAEILDSTDAFMDTILDYLDRNEFNESDYEFGTTLSTD